MTTTTAPTAEQIAAILAFEAAQTSTAALWSTDELATAGTGHRPVVTDAEAVYDMAGWTTVDNRTRRTR